MTDEPALKQLLTEARESLEMWADVVEARTGKPDTYTRGLLARIDVAVIEDATATYTRPAL